MFRDPDDLTPDMKCVQCGPTPIIPGPRATMELGDDMRLRSITRTGALAIWAKRRQQNKGTKSVSYTHLTLPTTPYV